MLRRFLLAAAVSAALVSGCSNDTTNPVADLVVPETYDSTAWRTNAASTLSLRGQLSALSTEMKKGRVAGTAVDVATLQSLYGQLSSTTTTYYKPFVDLYLTELAQASGGTYDPMRSVAENGQGGTYGAYLFDEHGLELEQQVEKGLFTASLYNHALSIMAQDPSVANVDAILGLYGAHPSFPNTDRRAGVADAMVASYAARRSDSTDANSLYRRIKTHFLTARAAAAAGSAHTEAYRSALTGIRNNWERSQMATVVNYCYSVMSTLSKTEPTASERASALHAYGECVGFLHGWKGIPAGSKIVTDATIDELLVLLRAPAGETPTSADFVTRPFETLGDIQAVITKIATTYGFTASELESFKKNWVADQNRQ